MTNLYCYYYLKGIELSSIHSGIRVVQRKLERVRDQLRNIEPGRVDIIIPGRYRHSSRTIRPALIRTCIHYVLYFTVGTIRTPLSVLISRVSLNQGQIRVGFAMYMYIHRTTLLLTPLGPACPNFSGVHYTGVYLLCMYVFFCPSIQGLVKQGSIQAYSSVPI